MLRPPFVTKGYILKQYSVGLTDIAVFFYIFYEARIKPYGFIYLPTYTPE